MSDQEQDAIIGKLVREHADAKRKVLVMRTELEGIAKAFYELTNGLGHNVDPDFNLSVTRRNVQSGQLAQYDLSRLLLFLEEYQELRKSASRSELRLRELGITI